MKIFDWAVAIALLLGLGLILGFAQEQPKPVDSAAWFCTTTSFENPVCFQYRNLVIVGPAPANRFLSFISGENFSINEADWQRLQTSGYLPVGLGGQ